MGCGANLQSGQAPTLQTTTQSAGKKKLLIGVGAGVGVLALAAVGFFVIYPKLSGDGTNQQLSETVAGPSNQQKAKMDPPLPDDIPSLEAFLKPGAHQLSAGHKTKAQYKLGKLLKEKASKAKSFTKERRKLYYEAKKHLTPAAENGHALAQWELGWVLHDLPEYGREEAIKWFKMSAEQGYMKAVSQLGFMHFHQRSEDPPEQIYLECIKWYTMAAENGYPNAAYRLAYCYYPTNENARVDMASRLMVFIVGSKRDPIKAYVWWSIASKRNFNETYSSEAPEQIEFLKKRNLMSPGQIAEADALVEKMIKDNPKLIERFPVE
jgi:TPR repeat protein